MENCFHSLWNCWKRQTEGNSKCAAVSAGQTLQRELLSVYQRGSKDFWFCGSWKQKSCSGSGRKSSSQFKLEQLNSQERHQEGQKNVCCTFSEIPTKLLITFRISFDGLWCVLANSLFFKWDCAWLFQSHIIHSLHWQRAVCVPVSVPWLRRRFHCCFSSPCSSGGWGQRAWCTQPLTLKQQNGNAPWSWEGIGFIVLDAYCRNLYGLVFYC